MTEPEKRTSLKDIITVVVFLFTIAGYGVAYGRLSQRVDNLDARTVKVEDVVDNKLAALTKAISDQNVQIAVLAEQVKQLNQKVK